MKHLFLSVSFLALIFFSCGESQDSNLIELHRELADLKAQIKYDDAVKVALKALSYSEETYGKSHNTVANSKIKLADLYSVLAKYELAAELYTSAIGIYKLNYGNNNVNVAEAMNKLAFVQLKQAKTAEADRTMKEVANVFDNSKSDSDEIRTSILRNLANLKLQKEEFQNAEALYLKNVALSKLARKNRVYVANAIAEMASFNLQVSNMSRSESLYNQALEIYNENASTHKVEILQVRTNLALIYIFKADYALAENTLDEINSEWEKSVSKDHYFNFLPNLYRSILLVNQLKIQEAIVLLKENISILDNHSDKSNPYYIDVLTILGKAHNHDKNYSDAEKVLLEGISMAEKMLKRGHVKIKSIYDELLLMYRLTENKEKTVNLEKKMLAQFKTIEVRE